jgi:hypothetical protein
MFNFEFKLRLDALSKFEIENPKSDIFIFLKIHMPFRQPVFRRSFC